MLKTRPRQIIFAASDYDECERLIMKRELTIEIRVMQQRRKLQLNPAPTDFKGLINFVFWKKVEEYLRLFEI